MILHIVRSGETIRMIADNYQCEESDITSNNLHITDFKNLRAGMKLRIPFLSKPIIDVLEETESFISDYYPSLKDDFKPEFKEFKKENVEKETIVPKEEVVEVTQPEVTIEEPLKRENNIVTPYGSYSGNIIPSIPSKYIKKI